MSKPLLYWSRNRDLDAVIRERGFPMQRVEMLHQADLTVAGVLKPELMWPHAQRVSGQGGTFIVNLEHASEHTGPACQDPIHFDPRRSTLTQIERAAQVVADVMQPLDICAPAMVRTVTLACNLPYFRTGTQGEAGWKRAADKLVDAGMFALQTAHFFDIWASDDNRGGEWLVSKGPAPADEGQFDQAARLVEHLPPMNVLCQWAPVTRGTRTTPGLAMRPGVLARNIRHNRRRFPWVEPFLWLSGVASFDGATNDQGVRRTVDWDPGTVEFGWLMDELEGVFAGAEVAT